MHSFLIFLKLFLGATAGFFTHLDVAINLVPMQQPDPAIIKQLQEFESAFIYPFSHDEEFTIKHGVDGDYFQFFKQLGTPYYYVATSTKNKIVKKIIEGQEVMVQQQAGEIAAAGCAVLRSLTTTSGKAIKAWYICDLKVNEKYRYEHLPTAIVKKVALARFIQCPRGFAICMNPATGDPKAASIFKKHGPIKGIDTQILNLYTLSAQQVRQYHDHIQASFARHGYMKEDQKLAYRSTNGAKDYEIINHATDCRYPWKLVHLTPSADDDLDLQDDVVYMVCAVDGTPLNNDFELLFGTPSSTAQIVSYGMHDVDFNLLTSNQI